jgi:hypothetical protein
LVFLNFRDQRAVDRIAQLLGRWGFFYEIYSSLLHGLDGCRNVTLARDDYDIYVRPTRSEHAQDVEPVDVREVDVEKDAGALNTQGSVKKLLTRCECLNRIPLLLEQQRQSFASKAVVLNETHAASIVFH